MPPRWKGRTCQAPLSVSSLYSPSRSQAEQHFTLNQQAPETRLLSKEGSKPGVPRGPPGAGQNPCPVFTNPRNWASHPLCPTEFRAACVQWGVTVQPMQQGKGCELLTSVTVSCGMVAKLGEEKVKPLSVPAS